MTNFEELLDLAAWFFSPMRRRALGLAACCVAWICAADEAPAAVHVSRAVFTSEECATILHSFDDVDAESDERTVPLLPNMNGSFVVSRINRFASFTSGGAFDWVFSRMLAVHPALKSEGQDIEAFRKRIAFVLLHEFDSDHADFDWHADTKPGDGKVRTLNINVMLSVPDSQFGGGTLQVGADAVESTQGDLIVYEAALPHRVLPLTWGRRFTLVVALTDADEATAAEGATAADAGQAVACETDASCAAVDGAYSSTAMPPVSYASRRRLYWERVEAAFDALAEGPLSGEPKLHILHGEFLEGLPNRADDAQLSFCRAYKASGAEAAAEHVQTFLANGVAALQAPAGADLALGESYFAMANCIDPENGEVAQALDVVRQALDMRARGESG